ncbi:hypothetical protein VNO80_07230 [Phaseolus coccineus]|uniref:Uncharacterized protein n=1 Tax=Phaseolus coccineus TaxID=3886 RepID=A0AAN9NJR1_PHACN
MPKTLQYAFGADEFDTKTEEGKAQLESFSNWWYFLFTAALLVALTAVVHIQTNVSWLLFVSSFPLPKEASSVKVVVAASRKRNVSFYDPPYVCESEQRLTKHAQTNTIRCLDKVVVITDPSERDRNGETVDGWRLRSVQQVEELKTILATLPVWLAGIICFLSMGQVTSFGILQVLQTNRSNGPHFNVPLAWMGLLPMIVLSLWIFLYGRIYVPRIFIGILFFIACMVVSGLVEAHRRSSARKHGSLESPSSIWWLVPQFALSGLVEFFTAIPMRDLSIANSLNTILIRIIVTVTRNGRRPWLRSNDLNKNRLEYYYYTIAVLGGLNLLYFQFFSGGYLHNEVLQRPCRNEAEDEEYGYRP